MNKVRFLSFSVSCDIICYWGFILWNFDLSIVYWVDFWVYIREVSLRMFFYLGIIGVFLYIFRIVNDKKYFKIGYIGICKYSKNFW